MGDKNKGDAQLFVHILQFQLHLLTHLIIQGAQGLVQQQYLRLIDNGSGNGYPLLLSAGQGLYTSLFKALQINHFQSVLHLFVHGLLVQLFQFQTECHIIINIQMRKQRIFLENGIDRSLVGRKLTDVLAVQQNFTCGRDFKASQHAQNRSLTATGGT